MKSLMISILLVSSLGYASDLSNEDKEILKDLEFFSNLELLEDEASFEDLEELDSLEVEESKKGQQS